MSARFPWWISLALLAACNPFRGEVPEVKAGIEAFEQSKFEDAEKAFDEAIQNTPSSEAHFGKGATLHQLHKEAEAAEAFRRAITTKDDALKARAYLDLGNAEASAGLLDKAIEDYRRSLELVPTDHDALYNLEWALREKRKPQDKKDGQKQGGGDSKDGNQDPQKGNDPEKGPKDDSNQPPKRDNGGEQQGPDQPGAQKDDQQGKGEQDPSQPKPDAQQQQAQDGEKKPGGEQGEQGAQADAQKPGEQQGPGSKGEQARDGAQAQQGQQPDQKPGEESKPGGGVAQAGKGPKSRGKQDPAQVLDALQAGEKSLQMWRFQKQGDGGGRRTVDQDW